MVLSYHIEAADFQALCESVATGGSRRAGEGFARGFFRNLTVGFVVGLVGVILINMVAVRPPAWFWPALIGFLAAAVGFAVLFAVLHVRGRRRAVPLEGGSILGEQVLEVGPAGITQSSRWHRSESHWSGVVEVRNAGKHVFIMIDSCAGYIVPKRVFASPQEERSFFEAVEQCRSGASRGGA